MTDQFIATDFILTHEGRSTTAYLDPAPVRNTPRFGTSFMGRQQKLVLYIRITALQVPLKRELLVGRADSECGEPVDVDLTPFRARSLGVAYQHLLISRGLDGLKVADLNSMSGSYLNGARLLPYQTRFLHDGDDLRLGQLVMRVSFA
ncbi:MAG TPA: FHA domain-containing protein [Aggregatilineaceae bacterium]|nr:FHA domain-containing protein [Aggregatilineaceae bacterium]